jgi:hypothetical protein
MLRGRGGLAEQDQAGHAGSIPVARSRIFPRQSILSNLCLIGCQRLRSAMASIFQDGVWPVQSHYASTVTA